MVNRIVGTRLFYRIAEIIIPVTTWLVITFPIWLSFFHPALTAYIILAFFLYFFYKSIKSVYYAAIAYDLLKRARKIDWYKKVVKLKEYQEIEHFIIITNYKETEEKVAKTIEHVQKQEYNKQKIHIVLAMEEREAEVAIERGEKLKNRFGELFGGFHLTYHELIKGEVIGKASNETHASRIIYDLIEKREVNPKKVLITICDADSLFPKQYLAYLTYEFVKDSGRLYHFYWAPVLLYNNFWKLPLPVRVQSILSSVIRISLLPQSEDLIQTSTYSTNLWLLHEVGFWDTDIIPEDWHIWLQAFFTFGPKVKTIPIYLPVSADAVLAKGLWRTFKNRYEQERRWAWGASDIPYSIKRFFETPEIPMWPKIRKLILLIETHLLWPTSFFLLTISAWVPSLVNKNFARTVLGFILPQLSSFILTLSSVLLLVILYFDHKMREQIKIKTQLRNMPILFIQWYLLPIISFIFSSLPALEAHTRIILGKKLEYRVTEKV